MPCSCLTTYQVNLTANERDKAIRILKHMTSTRDSAIAISYIESMNPIIVVDTDVLLVSFAFSSHKKLNGCGTEGSVRQ